MEKSNLRLNKIKDISIELANISHSKKIWQWRNDPHTISMSKSNSEISWDIHKNWFKKTLANQNNFLYIGLIENQNFGIVRFEEENDKNNIYNIHINLNNIYRGRGLGKILLQLSIKRFWADCGKAKYIKAEIRNDNKESIKIFLFNHFKEESKKDGFKTFLLIRDSKLF